MIRIAVVLLLLASGGLLRAQIDLTVSDETVAIAPSYVAADPVRGVIHLLTSGIDTEFDGEYKPEDGDVSAGWYVLNKNGKAIDSMLFDGFFNSFPIRVGIDFERGLLYAPVNGAVGSFSLETLQPVEPTLIAGAYGAVSYDPDGDLLILSLPHFTFSDPGIVTYVDRASLRVVAEVESGINPGMSVAMPRFDIGGFGMYTINEGSFGGTDASLTQTAFATDLYGWVNEGLLGGGAADMVVNQGKAYILLGSTHTIRVIDTETHEETGVSPIDVGTSGFDSPRAMVLHGNMLIVGTYSDDIRRFDLTTGTIIDSIPTPGKIEDLDVVGDRLFAAVSYTSGTYDGDSLLLVVDLTTGTPVDTVVLAEEPAGVFADEEHNRVVVVGYTQEGTSMPWWIALDATTLEVQARGSINATLPFPLRADYDSEKEQLAIVGSNRLSLIDVTTSDSPLMVVFDGPQERGRLFGVSDAGDYWLVPERPEGFDPAPCYVHQLRKPGGLPVAELVTSGSFLLTAESVGSDDDMMKVYILHEGNFGSDDALLSYAEYGAEVLKGELGGGANHIVRGAGSGPESLTAVTMNGSHEVVMLDLHETGDGHAEVVGRIPTGTEGFDGPRESAVPQGLPTSLNDPLLVTAYTGELLLIADGEVLGRHEIGGKGEGIDMLDGRAYIANSFETGTYEPATTVSIVSFLLSSVDGGETLAGTTLGRNYPNPVREWTTVPFTLAEAGNATLELYDMTGALLATPVDRRLEAGSHELLLDGRSLRPGSYLYVLRVGASTFTERMEVVR